MQNDQSAHDKLNQVLQIPIGSYNFANATKWIFNIPIGHLFNRKAPGPDGQILQFPLNCKRIDFPEFTIGSTKASFLNYSFDISTRQNTTEKGITIYYSVSSNWLQYMMLLKWFELEDYSKYNMTREQTNTIQFNNITPTIDDSGFRTPYDTGSDPYYSTQGPIVPCNLYLLNNFNQRMCTINFQGAWLTRVKPVSLDYAKTSDTQLESSFELKFYKYNIDMNNDDLKNFFNDTKATK